MGVEIWDKEGRWRGSIHGFTFILCLNFYYMTSRRIWTQREDQVFRGIAAGNDPKNWAVIAKRLSSEFGFKKRTGKQCRERWFNHVDPTISKKGWTKNEEELLLTLHKTYGNRWTQIAEQMPGRSDNSIKNYFYSTVRRNLRRMGKLLGSKNSTGLMREIKPSTMTRVFGSFNEEEDQKLYGYLLTEGLTKNFLEESCQSIRNEIVQFSYYKPKKNDRIESQDKEKYEKVFWLLKKVNDIYEKVREEEKSQRTQKQIFRSYYQEMNREESEEDADSDSFQEEEDLSSEAITQKKESPLLTCRSTRTREIKVPANMLEAQEIPTVKSEMTQANSNEFYEKHEDFSVESSTLQRGNQQSTLQNIVEFVEEEEFNDPDFNIEIGDQMQKQGVDFNNLDIDMSKMSFRSPACNYGTPVSQVNFFKSPRNVRITCLNDYLMKLSGSLGKQQNEMSNAMNNSGPLKEIQKSIISNYFFNEQNK